MNESLRRGVLAGSPHSHNGVDADAVRGVPLITLDTSKAQGTEVIVASTLADDTHTPSIVSILTVLPILQQDVAKSTESPKSWGMMSWCLRIVGGTDLESVRGGALQHALAGEGHVPSRGTRWSVGALIESGVLAPQVVIERDSALS